MKLPITKKYFDLIKEGKKDYEVRDAHITFVCEETGEMLRRDVGSVAMVNSEAFPQHRDVLEDELVIIFHLRG